MRRLPPWTPWAPRPFPGCKPARHAPAAALHLGLVWRGRSGACAKPAGARGAIQAHRRTKSRRQALKGGEAAKGAQARAAACAQSAPNPNARSASAAHRCARWVRRARAHGQRAATGWRSVGRAAICPSPSQPPVAFGRRAGGLCAGARPAPHYWHGGRARGPERARPALDAAARD